MNIVPFKTYEEQITILEGRGLDFLDREKAIDELKRKNYYNLINGYKTLFLDQTAQIETFKKGTLFEEIIALYQFDCEIRHSIFLASSILEKQIKTQISYTFSYYHNVPNYLQYLNFDTLDNPNISEKNKIKQTEKIYSVIGKINSEISNYVSKHNYIKHNIHKHGYIPFWVLINSLSLGTTSKFFEVMKQNERVEVSKFWGNLQEKDLQTFMKGLAHFRNLCAHGERIFCSKHTKPINDTTIHKQLNIPKDTKGNYILGKTDLYSLVITFKIMLNDEDFINFFNKLRGSIERLCTKITTIPIDDVLKQMGFPKNWAEIKKM